MTRHIAIAAAFSVWGLLGWLTGDYPGISFFIGVAVGAGAMLVQD